MDTRSVEALLDVWAAADLITAEQAGEIRAFESERYAAAFVQPTVEATPEVPASSARIPVVGEVLGYVGGALAIAALFALATQFWGDLGPAGRLALAGLVSVACAVGGMTLSGLKAPQAQRLGGFLLLTATAAIGFFSALLADMVGFLDSRDLQAVIGTGAALAAGFGFWFVRRTSLQLVALSLALAFFISASAVQWFAQNTTVLVGVSYLSAGVVWVVLGELQALRPRTTAWALGSLAIVSAPQILHLGYLMGGRYLALGCFVSFVLLGAALWLGRLGPLGFGAAGIVIYVPQLLFQRFENTLGVPIALLVAGVLLVVMSAVVLVAGSRLNRGASRAEV